MSYTRPVTGTDAVLERFVVRLIVILIRDLDGSERLNLLKLRHVKNHNFCAAVGDCRHFVCTPTVVRTCQTKSNLLLDDIYFQNHENRVFPIEITV
jgi:hypothetical protein